MSKAVLISIRPKWCELIASGKKTIEVRKTRPKIETPFKCYIYCTKGEPLIYCRPSQQIGNGKVIGEFVCDKIYGISPDENGWGEEYGGSEHDCLSDSEMLEYLGDGPQGGFGWHISDLVIYDTPKKYVNAIYKGSCQDPTFEIKRPPQSWCYVEELS